MSRTYRTPRVGGWRAREEVSVTCLSCGHTKKPDKALRCPSCNAVLYWGKCFHEYKYLKRLRDGEASKHRVRKEMKRFCSKARRSAERRDLYNLRYQDNEYIDTESKIKGALWIFY